MVAEAVTRTSDMAGGFHGKVENQGANSSDGSRSNGSAEDRLTEAVVELILKNGKVQSAIMDLVLSSPYVQWEL